MTHFSQLPKFKKNTLATLLFLGLCVFFFLLFSGLGIWQLQRLQWKNALISHVETRLHLPPTPAPLKTEWESVTAETHEYRPVITAGQFVKTSQILVSAVTDYGSGYWLMQALRQEDGAHIFINRGFVPMDWKLQNHPLETSDGQGVEVMGLIRLSEGAGFFPRRNDPARDRWYSRQLEAFAKARNLENVAPYFIDANADPNREGVPIAGLTIVNFRNTHLSYALTWFVMATGVLAAFIFLIRQRKNP